MKRRNRRGVSMVIICLILGMLIMPLVGLLTFEIARAFTMHAQLRHACQAAALAGVARMASSDSLSTVTTHNDTISAARDFFKANSINEYSLGGASNATSANDNPAAGQSSIFVELLDVNNNPVAIGNVAGRIVHAVGAFGLVPVFGPFLGLGGPYTIRAEADGQVPNIDLVMGFDTSGSIDDQTPITAVQAYWDTNNTTTTTDDKVNFRISNNGSIDANGRLYDVFNKTSAPSPTGLAVQAGPQQSLSSFNGGSGAGQGNGFAFYNTLRNTNSANGPPGNTPGTGSGGGSSVLVSFTPSTSNRYYFTHLLVNLNVDGNNKGKYPQTFGVTTVAPIAEHTALAAGWLDSTTAFNQAKLNINQTGVIDIVPSAGRRASYEAAIRPQLQPIRAAQDAAQAFFTIMHNNTDSHFGLTTINTNSYTTTQQKSDNRIASNYTIDGTHQFPEPGIALTTSSDNFSSTMAALPTTVAAGSTNI
ncbi:MAG: hypothetical protein K2Z81_21390, partial [Cyanobacteria bacterium]|nr:hypothetical protein [Cyanobacteriota bacterium]